MARPDGPARRAGCSVHERPFSRVRSPPREVTVAIAARQVSFEDLGTPLFAVTFAVVDLETTGLSPERDRITEIGVVKVRGGDVLGEFQCLVSPGVPIPLTVTRLTGITDALVADRPPIEAALPALLEFLRGTTLVAHNASFDVSFLQAACRRHDYPPLDHPVVDTARIARRVLLRGEVRDHRLGTLAAHFRARTRPEHRALADARATVDVLHGLLERVGSLGVSTLEDLRDYVRSTSDPAFRKVGLVEDAPDAPGIYRFLDDRGEVLYVGKAARLRQRLRQYFGQDPRRKIADLVRLTERVEWELTPTELEAQVREVREIGRLKPRFNRRSRHPEKAVYVKLTREPFPRLSIVTAVRDARAVHVGPLRNRQVAERFLEAVHEVVPLRTCSDRLSPTRGRSPCALKDLGRCGAPCDGSQDPDVYARVVASYADAVTVDPAGLLGPLRQRMRAAARAGRFEQAGRARDRLHHAAAVLAADRRLTSSTAAAELVALRPAGDRTELVVARRGRLAGSASLPASPTDRQVGDAVAKLLAAAPPPPPAGPPPREEVEELDLVTGWLAQEGVRLVDVEGELSEPVAGGAELGRTLGEARRVARQMRRDRQVTRGEK
jgi:DNA polymerase III subunit epsilon